MKTAASGRRAAVLAAVVAGVLQVAPAAAQPSFDFRRDTQPFVVFGEGARVERQAEPPALRFVHRLGGPLQILVLPLERGSLAGVQGLQFTAQAEQPTSLVVSLEEQGGGRWTTPVTLPGGRATAVRLAASDFQLAVDASSPPDPNGRLDWDRVRQFGLVDAAGFVAAQNRSALGFFGLREGERTLQLRELAFVRSAPARAGAMGGLDGGAPRWMVFGAEQIETAAETPSREAAMVLQYERRGGRALSALRPLPAGALDGAGALVLELGASEAVELKVTLEQSDGGKFEATLALPKAEGPRPWRLQPRDFKRAGDSRTRQAEPDWSRATQLGLLDAAPLFASRTRVRLWVAGVAREGGAAAAAPTPARALQAAAAPAELSTVQTPGWSAWTKRVRPILSGPFSLVGDPSVMRDGAVLRMVYNCFDPQRKRGAICMATSSDGLEWQDLDTGDKPRGRIVRTRPGEWDDAQETPFLVKWKGEYLLYFVGYRDRGGFIKSFPAYVGMAWSRDGVRFERGDAEPVIKTSPESWDHDAISSPSVVEHEGRLVMLYTAHCWTRCPRGTGITLLAATSSDGRRWVKHDRPVLTKSEFPMAKDGIAEAEVTRGPDGRYYLFYSLLYGDRGHEVGVAVAPSPFGPWRINPEPILRKSEDGFDAIGPIAPSVVFEGDRARMWFHGFSKRKTIEIGYAEAPWPLTRP